MQLRRKFLETEATASVNWVQVGERTRDRVNIMKHDAGLELDHFITEEEYTEAINAIEEFWSYLATVEQVGP